MAALMVTKRQWQCWNDAIDKAGEQEPRVRHETRGEERAEEEAVGADGEAEVAVVGGEKKKKIWSDMDTFMVSQLPILIERWRWRVTVENIISHGGKDVLLSHPSLRLKTNISFEKHKRNI